MNAGNINAPGSSDPLGRGRGIGSRQEIKRTDTSDATVTSSGSTETEARDFTVTPATDSYQATSSRSRIMELVADVEKQEPVVRQDVVQMVRQRVADGYYNSQEFMGALASHLINTER